MGPGIHEHDFLPWGQITNLSSAGLVMTPTVSFCGERIAMVVTRRDHGVGKCIKSRQVIQGYEEGEEKLQQN